MAEKRPLCSYDGEIQELKTGDTLPGGDGGGTPSDTVVTETSFGQSSSPGSSITYQRGDHTHGTPADPVPAHAAVTASVHNFDVSGNAPAQAHDLGGAKHNADTLANLNAKISDADVVALAGQIGGTAASPDVRGIRETGVPTLLTLGAISDGQYLQRSGNNVVGVSGYTLKGVTVLTPGSGTYNTPTGVRALLVECQGPGGGGGGVSGSVSNAAGAGGGGSGGYCMKFITSPSSSYSYVVGSGGAGGPSGNNNGSNGSADTTFGTLTAGLGSGGAGMAYGTAVAYAAGGVGGSASGGDINIPGQRGGQGRRHSGTDANGFAGSNSVKGFGGAMQGNGNGNAGTGYGAGGGGASSLSASWAGGDGTGGLIVIWEYY